jgi:hypothetical protein
MNTEANEIRHVRELRGLRFGRAGLRSSGQARLTTSGAADNKLTSTGQCGTMEFL